MIFLATHESEVGLLDGMEVAPVVVVVVATVVVVVVVFKDDGCFVGDLVLSPECIGLLVGADKISLVGAGVGEPVHDSTHVPF